MRRPLLTLALLTLSGCDGQLLQGFGEVMFMVAMVTLAIVAVGLLVEAAILGLVVQRFRKGRPVEAVLKGLLLVVLALHAALVWDVLHTAIVQNGRADAIAWGFGLSLAAPLSAMVLAFGRPATPGSEAWNARVGGAALAAILLATAVSTGLWPWTERAVRPSGEVVSFVDAVSHTCALTTKGEVACWGDNAFGQTGSGPRPQERERPSLVPELGPTEVLVGDGLHTCALGQRRLRCWGDNAQGQLGPSLPGVVYTPTALPELGEVLEVGALRDAIWTREASGRLVGFGEGLSQDQARGPHALGTTPEDTVQTVVTQAFWCARRATGAVRCAVTGQEPLDLELQAVSLAATEDEACAVLSDGSVACWSPGDVVYERLRAREDDVRQQQLHAELQALLTQLNESAGATDLAPPAEEAISPSLRRVPELTDAQTIAASQDHLCVLTQSGKVRCWGEGFRGQLGDGRAESTQQPTQVALPLPAVALQLSEDRSCARTAQNRLFCWGQPSGVADDAYTLCHDTWLGSLRCVAQPAEVKLLP